MWLFTECGTRQNFYRALLGLTQQRGRIGSVSLRSVIYNKKNNCPFASRSISSLQWIHGLVACVISSHNSWSSSFYFRSSYGYVILKLIQLFFILGLARVMFDPGDGEAYMSIYAGCWFVLQSSANIIALTVGVGPILHGRCPPGCHHANTSFGGQREA